MSERQPFYHFACLFSYSGSYIVDTAVKLENYIFVPSPFPMALLPWSRVVRNLRNPLWGHSVVSERMVQNPARGAPACAASSLPPLTVLHQAAESTQLPILRQASQIQTSPALRQPRAAAVLITHCSAGILSTFGSAGGWLINNLVRVMDSSRIIA